MGMASPFPRVLWYCNTVFVKLQQLFWKKFVEKAENFIYSKKLVLDGFSPQDIVGEYGLKPVWKRA